VAPGSTVTLDGTASRDPAGGTLTYAWTLSSRPLGSSAALAGASTANPTLVVDVAGSYVLSLVVRNATTASTAATVTLTAAPTNATPTARAGSAQNVLVNATVLLDGSTSTDPDGDPLSYQWTLIVSPTGSRAALASPTAPQATFVADLPGTYTAALVVNDGTGNSLSSLVTVTASAGNAAPVARTGRDQNTVPGRAVTLDASASGDANGDPLTWRWSLSLRPAGSTAALSGTSTEVTTFTPDVVGRYEATLVVNDGLLDSAPAVVAITVSTANLPPVADAGPALRVPRGERVVLDGRRSSDANGDTLTYQWSLTARPAGSAAVLADRSSAQPSFLADVEGVYVASLVVNDGNADSTGATVTVTAVFPPLPVGTGLVAQERGGRLFQAIDGTTGNSTALGTACATFSAADTRPDGVVLAAVAGAAQLQLVDVRSGDCKAHFAIAEPMAALAVAADGTVLVLTQALTAGARQVLRYSADGSLLSQRAVSGLSGLPGVPDLNTPQAMDLAPDGTLLVLQGGALWQLDPATGIGTLRATGLAGTGDIDIDASGVLRTIEGGQLRRYSGATGALLDTVPLLRDLFGPSALVLR
jgi:PKD domain